MCPSTKHGAVKYKVTLEVSNAKRYKVQLSTRKRSETVSKIGNPFRICTPAVPTG